MDTRKEEEILKLYYQNTDLHITYYILHIDQLSKKAHKYAAHKMLTSLSLLHFAPRFD